MIGCGVWPAHLWALGSWRTTHCNGFLLKKYVYQSIYLTQWWNIQVYRLIKWRWCRSFRKTSKPRICSTTKFMVWFHHQRVGLFKQNLAWITDGSCVVLRKDPPKPVIEMNPDLPKQRWEAWGLQWWHRWARKYSSWCLDTGEYTIRWCLVILIANQYNGMG